MEEYTILWDWDNTIVTSSNSGNDEERILKAGVVKFLDNTLQNGLYGRPCRHIVASDNHDAFLLADAQRFKVREKFKYILGRNLTKKYKYADGFVSRNDLHGKIFQGVLNKGNISEADIAKKVVLVGDALGDIPLDRSDLVFIYEHGGVKAPLSRITGTINALLDAGDGRFLDGFKRLYGQASSMDLGPTSLPEVEGYKTLPIGDTTAVLNFVCAQQATQNDFPEDIRSFVPTIYLGRNRT